MHWHQSEDDVEIWQICEAISPHKRACERGRRPRWFRVQRRSQELLYDRSYLLLFLQSNFNNFQTLLSNAICQTEILTNNKNMDRNQIWFNLKIKDAWKTSIVPDILTKCRWKLLYTAGVWTPEYVLNCIRRIPCGWRIFHHHLRVFNSRDIQYSLFISSPLRRSPMELKFQPIMSTLFLSLLSYLTPR